VHTLPGKIKNYIFVVIHKTAVYIWLLCQILTDFNNFCSAKTGKKYTKQACIQGCRQAVRASDLHVVRTGPVCCEPRHRRLEASSVSLCRRWRQTFWTLLMISTLKITMSKLQQCKFDNWRWLFLFSFAVNVNEQRIIAFLTEKCYLNLRSKVCTQLRWCGKFYYSHI